MSPVGHIKASQMDRVKLERMYTCQFLFFIFLIWATVGKNTAYMCLYCISLWVWCPHIHYISTKNQVYPSSNKMLVVGSRLFWKRHQRIVLEEPRLTVSLPWYCNFIAVAKSSPCPCYCDECHIIPKSFSKGTREEIVFLTHTTTQDNRSR